MADDGDPGLQPLEAALDVGQALVARHDLPGAQVGRPPTANRGSVQRIARKALELLHRLADQARLLDQQFASARASPQRHQAVADQAEVSPRGDAMPALRNHGLEHAPNCGGELKIIIANLEHPVIVKLLARLGLQARAPPPAPARGQALQVA